MNVLPFDLGSLIWMIIWVITVIIGVSIFIVFEFWYTPAISRWFRKVKHSNRLPAFIQTNRGTVKPCLTNKDLPEGIHAFKKGKTLQFYFLAKKFYEDLDSVTQKDLLEMKQKFMKIQMKENQLTEEKALEEWDKLGFEKGLTNEQKKELDETVDKLLQTPILEGLGKPVFFGAEDAVCLTNLQVLSDLTNNRQVSEIERDKEGIISKIKLVAEAKLRNTRLISPIMFSKTMLNNLQEYARHEGYAMRGMEQFKILMLAIAGAVVIASLGIVAYMLTQ